ncbi:unnamed protein product [Rotaria magnacalcarata]|uniref:DNA-directed primase/polymerase protein n=1 Tax=Rotaria magnacalcarata TaxID=392030 RepID=A0A816GNS9_9BILA|nr:unnamed protein product [Rotaria magnacalcarata]CAF2086633.1 unnamed protein product [Rotaria magnacalcarata]CAF3852284.1 unnamed protein product [Rotaria magnacalcarata]CAF4060112.1 unnamed protein product [Rotaria magnacalcarata]
MTYVEKLLKHLFQNIIITHRLSDLTDHLSQQNLEKSHIYITIEKDNGGRQFTYLTHDQLITLYEHCPVMERSLYELIFSENQVKLYIDFEYYTNNNADIENSHIGSNCCLKILYYLFNMQINDVDKNNDCVNIALQQFLVLEASTSKKISFHFIHANPTALFENNITLGLFIKIFVHYLLSLIVKHKCLSFDVDFTLQTTTISDLITLLTPYVTILRRHCTKCQLLSNYMTVAEISHLLVLNTRNQLTLAIDLHVYSKCQQFRLLDSVKRGKNNFLHQSTYFPFNDHSNISYIDLLKKSLVTNIKDINVPIIYLENNKFTKTLPNTIISSPTIEFNINNLNYINDYTNHILISDTNCMRSSSLNRLTVIEHATNVKSHQNDTLIKQFIPFVKKMITSNECNHGYISSCVRGNRNTDLIFFNIAGTYRYCPRIGTHHQSNTTAIIIDTKNHTYSIRCKDPNCDNRILIWNKIE